MHSPTPTDLKQTRERLGMSQAEFAKAFRLNLRTLQDWELGRTAPSGAAATYVWLVCKAPRVIQKLLRE